MHKHMGIFQYTATDRTAKIIQGSMEAADERAVVTWLQANGYYPIKIGQAGAMVEAKPSLVRVQSRFARGPSAQDVLAGPLRILAGARPEGLPEPTRKSRRRRVLQKLKGILIQEVLPTLVRAALLELQPLVVERSRRDVTVLWAGVQLDTSKLIGACEVCARLASDPAALGS